MGVRLASDDVLLPFYDRAREVRDLLFGTDKNRNLIVSLEMLFSSSPGTWAAVKSLLCEVDRDELTDKIWLESLYSIVFTRSSAIWCRLADCIGAHDMEWTGFAKQPQRIGDAEYDSGIIHSDDDEDDIGQRGSFLTESDPSLPARLLRTPSSISSFTTSPISPFEIEALHELPRTFREAPIKMEKLSYRLSDDEEGEVGSLEKADEAASKGLLSSLHRLDQTSEKGRQRPIAHRRTSSVLSSGQEDQIQDLLKSRKEGFAGVRLTCPIERRAEEGENQDSSATSRNRSVSAPSTMRGVRREGDISRLHKFTHHRRLSNLFMSSIVPEEDDRATTARRLAEDRRLSQHRSVKSPRLQWASDIASSYSYSYEAEPSSPSSFAQSFQNRKRSESSPANPPTREAAGKTTAAAPPAKECTIGLLPDGRTRHPSAGEDARGGNSKEAAALLSFKNELQLSGYYDAKNKGGEGQSQENATFGPPSSALSPSLSDDSRLGGAARNIDDNASTPATSPDIAKRRPALSKEPSGPVHTKTKARHPVIFAIPRSSLRSGYLTHLLDRNESKTTVDDIKAVTGQQEFAQLCQSVNRSERDTESDQKLLERIGRDYFHLVDSEKDSKEDVERQLVNDQYESRWTAFIKLCQIWKVDGSVLDEAKRRSGPALKLF